MAGLGFRLQRLVADAEAGGWLRAHIYGAVLAAGPWLLSICSVAALAVVGRALVGTIVHDVFAAIVGYTYTVTLITTGLGSMALTRHLADVLYAGDRTSVLPLYRQAIAVTALVHAGLAAVIYALIPDLGADVKVSAAVLAVAIACTWIATVFTGAAEDYAGVTVAFFAGNAVAVAAALAGGHRWGAAGYVGGFAAGQVLVFVALTARLETAFADGPASSARLASVFRRYPDLALAGALYGLALAVDRMLFWMSSEGIRVVGWFRHSPYDAPMFLAYLSVVPSLAVFLLSVETEFYRSYRRYYGAATQHGTLAQVVAARVEIGRALHDGLARVLMVQAPVTLAAVTLAPVVGEAFAFEPLQVSMLRTLLVGAVPHVLTLFGVVLLLYFDRRRQALLAIAAFGAINAAGTAITLVLGPAWYGLGFAGAALASCLLTQRFLAQTLDDLEYLTFAAQPLAPRVS
ncbi:MAG TPA: exopolysaccharide Pel transporter PelG [Methylomirabilota bacterium]|jgi:uncharacterized membrane protein|nr:exopolysaccharide Pel transporter PelG [Methylomirabilota bacterium]